MLDAGIIRPRESTDPPQYGTEFTCAAKKDEQGDWTDLRFCNDFRTLNSVTPLDRHPLPLADDIFNTLGTSKVYSKIDLRAGFNQIPVKDTDIPKTAFWFDQRLYEYVRMPFGLKNAPIYFQRIMDKELHLAQLCHCVWCFIDDIVVYSNTPEEHIQHVQQVLDCLHACGLRYHPGKSVFMTDSVEYLGHYVSPYGLSPSAAKVNAILDMPAPKNLDEVRSVMGFFQYYQKYVPNFSAIARPITDLTRKNHPFVWTYQCAQAFAKLKAELVEPGRALRRPDYTKPFTLHTDFSNVGIGAVLSQFDDDGTERMVAAVSRSLTVHERIYSPYQGELLAVVWAIKTFYLYLHGSPFTLVTDHQPLQWLFSRSDLTGQSARWVLLLQEYEFNIVHRPGKTNANADGLSRMPLSHSAQVPMHPVLAAVPPVPVSPPLAHRLVRSAYSTVHSLLPTPLSPPPSHIRSSKGNMPVSATFHSQAAAHGIVLVDLCGGVCTALEASLQLGYTLRAYAYADVDPIARLAAHHRVSTLQQQYPTQLPLSCASTFMDWLPQDIRDIRPAHISHLQKAFPDVPILLVCGWPCQDVSSAGPNTGLTGHRSSLVYTVLQLLNSLLATHTAPVAYVLENAAAQHNFQSEYVRTTVHKELHALLGPSITIDAAQCGSYAHRLRSFWTNLADAAQLQALMSAIQPPPRRVQDILDAGRSAPHSPHDDQAPYFPVNVAGKDMAALPTLVSHPASYSFHPSRPGLMLNADGTRSQPTPTERERALGLATDATAAPGLTPRHRHSLTGRCIDLWCLTALLHSTHVLASSNGSASLVSSSVTSSLTNPLYPHHSPIFPHTFESTLHLPAKSELPTAQHTRSLQPVSFNLMFDSPQVGGEDSGATPPTGPYKPTTVSVPNFVSSPIPHPPLSVSAVGGMHFNPAASILVHPHTDEPAPRAQHLRDEDPDVVRGDIYSDAPVMSFLHTGILPPGVSAVDRMRIKHRAQGFTV